MAADPPPNQVPARFAPWALEDLNPWQRPLGEQVLKVSSVGLGGPYNLLLRSPVMGQRMFDLLYYLRWNSSLPLRLVEMAILLVGRQWRSQVEWLAHEPLALKAGLAPALVADLKAQRRPAAMDVQEAALFDFVSELLRDRRVGDATFERVRAAFDEQQIVDLTTVAGTYVTIAMLLEMARQGVPPGRVAPFGPDA